jgi:hypothetical protein
MKIYSILTNLMIINSFASSFLCRLCPNKITHNVTRTSCFKFGDCIDKGQDDNTFYITQLEDYVKQAAEHLTHAFQHIDLDVARETDIKIFDGTPKPMCIPSEDLIENDAFLRKMHGAYRLSEAARRCKFIVTDMIAQVLSKLEEIAIALARQTDAEYRTNAFHCNLIIENNLTANNWVCAEFRDNDVIEPYNSTLN